MFKLHTFIGSTDNYIKFEIISNARKPFLEFVILQVDNCLELLIEFGCESLSECDIWIHERNQRNADDLFQRCSSVIMLDIHLVFLKKTPDFLFQFSEANG